MQTTVRVTKLIATASIAYFVNHPRTPNYNASANVQPQTPERSRKP